MGPIGSGKTTVCLFEITRRAREQAPGSDGLRHTRWAIVRNTRQQLKDTTLKSFIRWFPPGVAGAWKESEMTFTLRFADAICEILFRPLDTPEDVQRLLSLELTGAYINECRELPEEIVVALRGRLGRYPSGPDGTPTWHGLIGDTNPPPEDTWWYQNMEVKTPSTWAVFKQPGGLEPNAENRENLPERYYEDLMEGASEEFIRVYVHGQYGRSMSGRPVYEHTFIPSFHVSKEPLRAIKSTAFPLVIGMDFGRTPAAIVKQRDHKNRVLTLDELVSTNMGLERFVDTRLKPLLASKYPENRYVICGDPSGWYKGQMNEETVADVFRRAGLRAVPAPTNDSDRRIAAVEGWLAKQVDGAAAYLVDPECSWLIQGFKSGYRYRKRTDGRYEPTPYKNEYSHPHDANQYADLGIGLNVGDAMPRRREVVLVSAKGWT